MGEWFGDNYEFIIGTALALLGLAFGIRRRAANTLDWDVVLAAPLLSRHAKNVKDGLEVTYGSNTLDDPHILILRVENTGRSAVRASDYVSEITYTFKENVPFGSTVSRESTDGIIREDDINWDLDTYDLTSPPQVVRVKPDLLNRRDWFHLQFIFDGKPGEIEIASRYAGQTRRMQETKARGANQVRRISWVFGSLMALGTIIGLIVEVTNDGQQLWWYLFMTIGPVGLVALNSLTRTANPEEYERYSADVVRDL